MGKTRVGVLVRESLGGNKSTSRSADLVQLTQKYHAWAQKVRALVTVLEKHQAMMLHMDASRAAVSLMDLCKRIG